MPSYQCPDHQVKRRLQGQKEADLRRLTITEVDKLIAQIVYPLKSSPVEAMQRKEGWQRK